LTNLPLTRLIEQLPTQHIGEWQDDDYVLVPWVRRSDVLAALTALHPQLCPVCQAPIPCPYETMGVDEIRHLEYIVKLKQAAAALPPQQERMFPIQNGPDIPWSVISPFDKQCQKQHSRQTLERLAERGGLSMCEALSVLEGGGDYDKYWDAHPELRSDVTAQVLRLQALVKERQVAALPPQPQQEEE